MTEVTRIDDEQAQPPALPPAQAQSRTELQLQIEQAVARPRELSQCRARAVQLATLDEATASDCFYSLPPRSGGGGERIEGPSARFAEVLAHTWGNCRAGARIIRETHDHVTAQGVWHDLETNSSVQVEVQRRITTRQGRRYSADMVQTTSNAACSIALRQAVLKGVPKALWQPIYDAAVATAVGDAETLAKRRATAMAYVTKLGANEAHILATLGAAGVEDIGLQELRQLKGLCSAVKAGDLTVEAAFPPPPPPEALPQAAEQALRQALDKAD